MSATDYSIDGKPYEGFYLPAKGKEKAPLIVIAHAWGGLSDNEKHHAKRVSEQLGCAAFAMDIYGKGKRGTEQAECEALMTPLVNDRAELQNRLAASLAFARTLDGVEAGKAAAIGYCFGGLCVLDMARAGMDVQGVASFHGLFAAAPNIPSPKIKAKVMIEHGWLDPMAKPDDVLMIAKEMNAAGADWQLHAHGKAMHSFTTKGANNPDFGTVYDADADRRSLASLKNFIDELF